ncbi:hypothetical protein F2Q69_00045953 [Brassica cretica]|uniref:Uncharacterized protein n=1 Tax=Brassica cretica TaxID=69181 RepID=A0A8S9PDE0_BRACR|nr:hypothetical protein F2Q69_00045953 [Brassica cretica]
MRNDMTAVHGASIEEYTRMHGFGSYLLIDVRDNQAERELAEYRAADARERNQTLLDPLRGASNPQNAGSNSRADQQNGKGNRERGSHRQTIRSPKIKIHPPRGPSIKREEEPVTPKPNRKDKVSTNKRGRETEPESPSSPPPAPKKRVNMILWGRNSNTTNEIKNQSEGKICIEVTVAIRTLEKSDEATPLPSVTHEETRKEEEEPVTPKPNRKAKVSTNKRGRETEPESPISPPPAPKKRVDMISWGRNSNTTNEIKNQSEGKICIEVTVAIRTLEKSDEATPPPSVTQYNPNTESPCGKIPNFKRKNKMTKIRKQLENPTALQIQKKRQNADP